MAAMVNMNSLLNGKDSRWLQLEVCREFQRNKCSRQDTECKFAHPPANVEVQNGKVTACYDSIKGRCNRDKPPCKYFHPPQHLKDQLLINGRNHLALKNALMQQMGIGPGQPVIPGQVPAVASNPYLTGIPANTYSPYFAPGHLVPALLGPDPSAVSQLGPVVPQAVQVAQQKIPRSDRLETAPVSVSAATLTHPMSAPGTTHPHPQPSNAVAAAISHSLEVGKKRAAESDLFQLAFSGMVPYKRPAAEKSGIPVYQPGATTYQQLMQLQQPPFVPVSCEYQPQNPTTTSTTTTTATTSAATANPQPQTSITTTTSTTSATTLANLTNLYAANNNLQLNFTQSPNFSTALISQNHFTNNLVDSSGNNAEATTTKTIATCNNNASVNVNSYNKNNNSLYNYSNNKNNSNNNNNILSFVNNNNNTNSNSCSQKSPTTTPTQLLKNPFATAITSHGTSSISSKSNDLFNGTSDLANADSTNSNAAANGDIRNSTEHTNTNNNITTASANNPIGNTATPTAMSSEACSPQPHNFQNDSDTESNVVHDKSDFSDILTQQQQHILQHDFASKSKTSTNPFNGTAATKISEVPLPNTEVPITTSTGIGILPTPISTAASSQSAVHTSAAVVTNTYQAQQNMQRLYNAHPLYQSGVASYANALASHAGYTPSTNTITNNHYTSQAITVPSPYGTIVSAAGTPAYSYASAPHHYVNSTAVGNPTTSYYHDAASLAKEVAQKNYANAVKMAAASNVLSGKPLTAATTLNYTGMALNKPFMPAPAQATAAAAHAAMAMVATNPHHHAALMQAQQQQAQVQQVQAAQQQAVQAHAAAAAAAQMRSIGSLPSSGMSTPVGTPVHTPSATPSLLQRPGTGYIQAAATTMLRPQPIQLATVPQPGSAANSYAAAAQAAANHQYVAMQQQQGFFYPGMMASASYPFAAMSTMQAMQGLPTMTQMSAPAPPTAGSAVVLNPYKKMKTS